MIVSSLAAVSSTAFGVLIPDRGNARHFFRGPLGRFPRCVTSACPSRQIVETTLSVARKVNVDGIPIADAEEQPQPARMALLFVVEPRSDFR